MNQINEDLARTVERINRRVTYEWDLFMNKHGSSWDDLSEQAKLEACELAEKIAERWNSLNE